MLVWLKVTFKHRIFFVVTEKGWTVCSNRDTAATPNFAYLLYTVDNRNIIPYPREASVENSLKLSSLRTKWRLVISAQILYPS